ncbi:uncharacterized protein LOC129950919 isoform X2 [Eupeodes corollae]|uniref:uncharacterized protein LOC129950919 isoform X2 n=1 Tax=Eupeodes corollae TaxID=290404 RepID=UPI00249131E3|nr:uncharacterized protein LOC129950919 isoform X2 [Eupeodes corollae]
MSSLYKILLLLLKCLFTQVILCFPLQNETYSVYDQRQTGKYNIHISLKDVAIIEVDKNEFSDDTINNGDEYYYDEEDLTISPIPVWISTTIRTPQVVANTTKNITVVKEQSSLALNDSNLDSNHYSPIIPSLESITLKYNMKASVGKNNVSQVPSEFRLKTPQNVSSIFSNRKVKPRIPIICRNYQLRDAYGNCRSVRRQTLLKSLLDMIQLMRVKN